jgi:hypothetical protein
MIAVSHGRFGRVQNINRFSLSHRLIVNIRRRRRAVSIGLRKSPLRP